MKTMKWSLINLCRLKVNDKLMLTLSWKTCQYNARTELLMTIENYFNTTYHYLTTESTRTEQIQTPLKLTVCTTNLKSQLYFISAMLKSSHISSTDNKLTRTINFNTLQLKIKDQVEPYSLNTVSLTKHHKWSNKLNIN